MTTTFANKLLLTLFQNAALAKVGDASGIQPSGTTGSWYLSLHTADPSGGDQTTSESGYTGYARLAVARTSGGWTVSSNQLTNAATAAFNACTGGASTITHFGIGTDISGAGLLAFSAPLISTYFDFTGKSSTNIITAPGHNLIVDDQVEVLTIPNGTLPSGTAAGTIYFVKTVSGDDITLSATQGGSTLSLVSNGAGALGKISTLAVSNGITPQFNPGALVMVVT
jgi:hypothetical protein